MEEINYTFLSSAEKQRQFAICADCENNINDACNWSGVIIFEITTYHEYSCPINKWSE